MILIGGTWDSATTAALPAINTAVKAQGIEKIYNFDPHLDNAGADTLVNINDKNNAVDAFAKRFQQTIDEFGLTDLQSKNTANVVDLPTCSPTTRTTPATRCSHPPRTLPTAPS